MLPAAGAQDQLLSRDTAAAILQALRQAREEMRGEWQRAKQQAMQN
jgi:hypothetical protein